ncbi:hypothetical protein GQ55_3G043000 [Panicum hallii var. hallii]|uniref:Uncharacterized protein n=1 Tax=Panicum hallii var. hallii TaxID=1504633 RepID=A0A2T7E5L7_9POAL|nr:hypothetical protein GQ55_3G043000 [Panicum hallii var. hallii]
MHHDRLWNGSPPLPLSINGAARRRSEAAHARRRTTSEHGAHHVARAAPAARAGSEDGAAVRVHRRRTDQGGHGAPLLRPGRGARPGRTQLIVSLAKQLHAMGPEEWSSVAPPLAGRQRLCIRILSLSLLAEERMRAPTPAFPPLLLLLLLLLLLAVDVSSQLSVVFL